MRNHIFKLTLRIETS